MLNGKEAAALLRGWDNIALLCHASPDGDTLGSACALKRGLAAMGKRARILCGDPIPEKFSYLFAGSAEESFAPEHVVTVDVADLSLLGSLEKTYRDRIELAIDHHGVHRAFTENRWVEANSAATAELIYLLLVELGAPIDRKTADCVYTGLTTDTGCFRYRNVTPRTHKIAARMLELGADGGGINQRMFESKSRAQMEGEKLALQSLEFFCQGKCAMVRVPLSLYRETGAKEEDLEGVASLPRQILGVVYGFTLKEKPDGSVKVSVRANPPGDAAAFCKRFGGGGHVGAAGCTMENTTLDQAALLLRKAAEGLGL